MTLQKAAACELLILTPLFTQLSLMTLFSLVAKQDSRKAGRFYLREPDFAIQ
jgi:hypothetical protein